jgi:hypothetical protein
MGKKLFLWVELDATDEEDLERLLTETLELEKKTFWLGELEEGGIRELNLSVDEDELFDVLESLADNGIIVKQVRRLAEG